MDTLQRALRAPSIASPEKGGVGKSFVALHLPQYFADQDRPTEVFDSDPATRLCRNYKALQAALFQFMEDDDLE